MWPTPSWEWRKKSPRHIVLGIGMSSFVLLYYSTNVILSFLQYEDCMATNKQNTHTATHTTHTRHDTQHYDGHMYKWVQWTRIREMRQKAQDTLFDMSWAFGMFFSAYILYLKSTNCFLGTDDRWSAQVSPRHVKWRVLGINSILYLSILHFRAVWLLLETPREFWFN